ncbi:amino acid permease [Streptomyces sp. Ru71]|uniref:amino acid permease n=1 Tax=Streptomyces sp. Ru71 TaxID=2080746 RepID=UPI0015E30676|nr:amino acid permease [Streptomyces sp. Ru71]
MQQLQTGLKGRHLSMIAIGGVIGAGLFVGSGAGIRATGPAILLSYALAGILVVLVMRMLGEMSAASPATGSFSSYADRALGRWAGFTIGWLYWWFWVVVLAVEATAGAAIVHNWIPEVPAWLVALAVMAVLTGTNLYSVGSYGEFEFWFSAIKVGAIVVFIALGGLAIFGLLPGTEAVGMANLTGHGGFFPHGGGAVVTGMLTVVFAFMGSEIVTIAAAESKDPGRAVAKAIASVIWRTLVFYLGSIAVVVTLLPWDSSKTGTSPYVAVLQHIGIPGAAPVMDFIVLTAVLSCLNSGVYTASRMAFSLAERGDAPRSWTQVTSRGVPRRAIWASVAFSFLAVGLNYYSPDLAFTLLLNSSGAVALFVWLVVAVSQLRLRRRFEQEAPERLVLRMWGFPVLTWVAIVGILAVLVTMLFDTAARPQLLWSVGVALVVLVCAWARQKRHAVAASRHAQSADPQEEPVH